MKRKSNLKRLLTTLFCAVFLFTSSSDLKAQEQGSTDLKEFKIVIEKTDNGLKMQSLKGSAWVDLSFDLVNYKPQTIDEYGMTKLDKESANRDLTLTNYLFTIVRTEDGIVLKGFEGTAWKELSFTLKKNGKQTIDQFGMTK